MCSNVKVVERLLKSWCSCSFCLLLFFQDSKHVHPCPSPQLWCLFVVSGGGRRPLRGLREARPPKPGKTLQLFEENVSLKDKESLSQAAASEAEKRSCFANNVRLQCLILFLILRLLCTGSDPKILSVFLQASYQMAHGVDQNLNPKLGNLDSKQSHPSVCLYQMRFFMLHASGLLGNPFSFMELLFFVVHLCQNLIYEGPRREREQQCGYPICSCSPKTAASLAQQIFFIDK